LSKCPSAASDNLDVARLRNMSHAEIGKS